MHYVLGLISGGFFAYLGFQFGIYIQREHPILAAFLGDSGPGVGRYDVSGMLPVSLAVIGYFAGMCLVGFLLSHGSNNPEPIHTETKIAPPAPKNVDGRGLPKDDVQAVLWYQKAAKRRDAGAK